MIEIPRIGEPRGQDALIAFAHRDAAIRRLDIGDENEFVREAPGHRVAHGKIFLVAAHRRGQHLVGERQKLRVERAHHHGGPFGKAGNLGEKTLVLDQIEPLRLA